MRQENILYNLKLVTKFGYDIGLKRTRLVLFLVINISICKCDKHHFYFFFIWPSGTLCDLSNKPRKTRVQYVCYTHGKHEVYSFKETSTCEYEIIILTPLLCEHPQFKTKEVGENVIDCLPVGDSPRKPRSLLKAEVDSLRFHQQTIRLSNNVSIASACMAFFVLW